MSMNDPISDLLAGINNGLSRGAKQVSVRHSAVKQEVVRVLQENGYILGAKKKNDGKHDQLVIDLKYTSDGRSTIQELKRVSKPGCRIYKGCDDIPVYQN